MRLVIIDGNAIVHRAYHALPPLTGRNGELLNAAYGFCTMLLKVIGDLRPDFLIVAFDTPKPTFRHKEYIGYQANRPPVDPQLTSQFGRVGELVEAMTIPIIIKEGFEADDVIGTITVGAVKDAGKFDIEEVIIVTGDRDLFQLVNSKVKVYMPIRGLSESQLFDEEAVVEKMGVKPSQIVDYKALTGDASDNYPGVAGIGPKTAVELVNQFGGLDNIYANLDEVGQKFSQLVVSKLVKEEEFARLSKKLAKIETGVPIKIDFEKCRFVFSDKAKEKMIDKLKELGFKSLAERVSGREESEKGEGKRKKGEEDKQLGLL